MSLGNLNNLNISSAQIENWLSSYDQFLSKWTVSSGQMAINNLGLVAGSFVTDDPYTSYTPPTTGTSEGQLLTIRGCLLAYLATKQQTWLDRATNLTNGLLNYYYPSSTIPLTPDPLWIPHWLVNVTAPFTARKFFLNYQATFVNGVYTMSMPSIIKVYTARATDATLDDQTSPASPITGTEYPIKSINYDYDNGKAVITLEDSSFSGTALLTYATSTGETVNVGDKCEAYPVWRHLDDGEIACAVDTLPWALDVFNLWYQITGDSKWLNAAQSTKASISAEYQVSDAVYYIKPGNDGDPVLENGVTSYSVRNPVESYTNSGDLILINYPAATGEASFGSWVGNHLPFTDDNYLELKLGSNTQQKVFMYLDEDQTYDPNKRWRSDFILQGNGLDESDLETIDLKPENFYKANQIFWGEGYGAGSDGSFQGGTGASVSTKDVVGEIDGINRLYKELTFVDPSWAQYIIGGSYGQSLPFTLSYQSNKAFQLLINDKNGNQWSCNIPASSVFSELPLTASMFSTATSATTADLEAGGFNSITLNCQADGTVIDIDYVGTKVLMTTPYYTNVSFGYDQSAALQVAIEYIEPIPQKAPLPYVPYIAPFDMHLVDGKLSDMRGAPYTGYQAPWIMQDAALDTDLGDDSLVSLPTNLQFLSDAQDAYQAATGLRGFFAPVFWWNYRDDADGNTPDSFGMSGPWGSVWGGFQYRTISDVARVLVSDPMNSLAKTICFDFFNAVNSVWNDLLTNFPNDFDVDNAEEYSSDSDSMNTIKPTNNQTDPHMVALLLRSLTYANYSTNLSADDKNLLTTLSNKCIAFLTHYFVSISSTPFSQYKVEGTFSPDPVNSTWYEYWGGDIVSALAILDSLLNETDDQTTPDSYYVYEAESQSTLNHSIALSNDSQYMDLQDGSPCVITIDGAATNPSWEVVQDGNVVATDKFNITLADNQKLVVSSDPDDQYARIYNPDGSYVDVSQYQDYSQTNFVLIPEGESTIIFNVGEDVQVNIVYKEERMIV
ncbi:hypothetical protein [Oenococcus oeni]|uniref:hypothetical protein n=1 Tax=Oenococcus oeni TaxID=1247 RepID=UPI00107874E1|nr:hypothetical protein [Oenococcus oeni]AVI94111.1 hypothetical protein AX764_04365 [Oenococcus oeni]SYV99687.1 conserved hypothetical protein [Oenococcus oeni]SYW03865.1 conserved hypothetical protein [Oenococcus oeni]SYW17644.1 conserved hypothetical protein [Oenococcus oeni]